MNAVLPLLPTVSIYVRHVRTCDHQGEDTARACRCPKHLLWWVNGKRYRKAAKTRSWKLAEQAARQLEISLAANLNGTAPIAPAPEPRKTLSEALELFLNVKRNAGASPDVVNGYERELRRFVDFMGAQKPPRLFPAEIRPEDVIHYQAKFAAWYPSTQTRAQVVTRHRGFFRFCNQSGYLERIPLMASVKINVPPTVPLSRDEYRRLVDAIPKVFEDKRMQQRIGCLVELMRYSGLACIDAIPLRRDRLIWDEAHKTHRVETSRTKTGNHVSVLLPPAVASRVAAVPNDHPEYLFWNTGSGKVSTAVTNWQHKLRALFRGAGFSEGHPHQLRDTFAVEMLAAGVPMEEVSRLLGHDSIKTTERYYAKWAKSRQDRLDSLVSATFAELLR